MAAIPEISVTIDKKAIASLPTVVFQGDIQLVDTLEQADAAVAELERHQIIGFDTETKPSFQKGHPNKVALMQLSTLDKCYLFRLNILGFPASLCRLIENADISKIGLSVHDDFHVMHRSSNISPQGFVELQDYVKDFLITDISLQKIFAILFGQKISKGQRLTNWEANELTMPQQVYAATDAWACLKIYHYLREGNFEPTLSPYAMTASEIEAKQVSARLQKEAATETQHPTPQTEAEAQAQTSKDETSTNKKNNRSKSRKKQQNET